MIHAKVHANGNHEMSITWVKGDIRYNFVVIVIQNVITKTLSYTINNKTFSINRQITLPANKVYRISDFVKDVVEFQKVYK